MQLNVKLTAAVYAAVALASASDHYHCSFFPWWMVSVVVIATFSRWAFSIHTRTHFPKQYPVFEELMLLVMGPFTVGLDEQRTLHMLHHGKNTFWTEADPDYLYYSAHPLVALVLCFFHPEISFFRMFTRMDALAHLGVMFRFIVFSNLAIVLGSHYLWYLLPLRIMFGIAQFVFTWVLHHRPEEHTINLSISNHWIPVLGSVAIKEFNTHLMHHAQ